MAKMVKSKDLVKVDNRFTEMHFKYTQEEMDILFYVMSIIRHDTTEYEFVLSDIEAISGKTFQRNQFRNSINSLAKRPYEMEYSEDRWKTIFVFKSIEYDRGLIRISLNEEILPILCDLKSNYSKIQLTSGFRLSGKYSKRLYLLLCRWRNLNGKIYEIDELIGILQYTVKESRNLVGWFKTVIHRAVDDINNNTDIHVDLKWLKTGRKTTHVNFSIRKGKLKEDEVQMLADPELTNIKSLLWVRGGVPEAVVERLYSEGCDYKTAEMVYNQANESVIKNRVKVNSPGAYLIECFKNKGYLMSDEERNTKIRIYREMIEHGADPEALRPVLDKLGIFIEEVIM